MKPSWPKIREIKYKSGKIAFEVALRGSRNERKYFEKKKEAEKFAEDKRKERENEGKSISMLSEELKSSALRAALRSSGAGISLESAVEFYLQHKKPLISKPIAEIVEEMLVTKASLGRRKRYIDGLQIFLTRFANHFSNKQLSTITNKDIEAWFKTQNWSNRTWKNHQIDLTTLYSFAIRQGYATENPISRMEVPIVEDNEIGILTIEECRKLLEGVRHTPWSGYVAICLFSGLRSSEALALDWSEINLKEGFITVSAEKSKTRQRRHVRIEKALSGWLYRIKDHKGPVCTGKLKPQFLAIWSDINTWKHNCLRHTYASMHLAFYRDSAKTAHELGHSNQSLLYKHYAQLVSESDSQQFWGLTP